MTICFSFKYMEGNHFFYIWHFNDANGSMQDHIQHPTLVLVTKVDPTDSVHLVCNHFTIYTEQKRKYPLSSYSHNSRST